MNITKYLSSYYSTKYNLIQNYVNDNYYLKSILLNNY